MSAQPSLVAWRFLQKLIYIVTAKTINPEFCGWKAPAWQKWNTLRQPEKHLQVSGFQRGFPLVLSIFLCLLVFYNRNIFILGVWTWTPQIRPLAWQGCIQSNETPVISCKHLLKLWFVIIPCRISAKFNKEYLYYHPGSISDVASQFQHCLRQDDSADTKLSAIEA